MEPHEVAGLLKAYVRELPEVPLTTELDAELDKWQRNKRTPAGLDEQGIEAWQKKREDDLAALIQQLPNANWFLLSDLGQCLFDGFERVLTAAVYLFELIPAHREQNRMNFEALVTSFGHSLQISGNVLAELVKRRERLFANPPPMSVRDEVNLISFGETNLTPPTMPRKDPLAANAGRPALPARNTAGPPLSPSPALVPGGRPPVAHQRSFSNLLNVGKSANKRSSQASLKVDTSPEASIRNSIVDLEPPKIDVPIDSPALPTFGGETEELSIPSARQSADASSLQRLEERHYEAGTVAQRANMFAPRARTPTPIADRFTSGASTMPSLRDPERIRGHSPSNSLSRSDPRPPASASAPSKRVSPFFTSNGDERARHQHSRSLSGGKLDSAVEMGKLQDNSKSPILGAELRLPDEVGAGENTAEDREESADGPIYGLGLSDKP